MQRRFINGFWMLFNFIHMYIISGNTKIDRGGVDVKLGGEVTINHDVGSFYFGPDYAPVVIAVLSMLGIILFNNIFRKEKQTLISNIEMFLIMLLLNIIMFRLRVNIMY